MRKLLVMFTLLLSMLALPLLASGLTASAEPGGTSGASAACENGGYLTYTTTDGTRFKNEGQCVKYAAKGNTLVLDPVARCRQEAIAANIDPAGFTIITGTENADTLTPTAGPDLICGFGGSDHVQTLNRGDVFLGGDGNDTVYNLDGLFNGGAGNDTVDYIYSGTFNGDDGDDVVGINGNIFNGGAGNDRVVQPHLGGTFNQQGL